MSKANNQFNVDFAFPGVCSLCHTEIAEFNGSNPATGRPIITRLKSNFREVTVILDDKSKMRVSFCENCFASFGPDDAQSLMESEINGWQSEVDSCCGHWEDTKKKEYMDSYSKRSIVTRHDKPWTLGEISRVKKPREGKLKVKLSKEKV